MTGVVPAGRRVARPVRSSARTGPTPGFWDTVGASFRTTVDEQTLPQASREGQAYLDLVAALAENGVDTGTLRRDVGLSTLGNPDIPLTATASELDRDAVWAAAERVRARNPKALASLPKSREEFERAALRRNGGRDDDQSTVARGGLTPALIGGAAGGFMDPNNALLSVVIPGGVGASVARRVLSGSLANTGVEAIQLPATSRNLEKLGEELTTEGAATRLGVAAIGGAGLQVAGEVAASGVRRLAAPLADAREAAIVRVWDRLPQAVRDKWGSAAKVGDDGLADIVEATIGRDRLSADENAAVAVLRRDGEVRASNPFVVNGAGAAAHRDRMAEAMTAILADAPVSPGRAGVAWVARGSSSMTPVRGRGGGAALDTGIVGYFQSKGYSPAQARGIAAGIAAESRNSHTIRNPTSGAYGLGQWLGSRKRELFRRYGQNPTREQQLEYLDWELRGGDHGGRAVLGASDEAGALNAYIQKFMRPAKGAETTGDLSRGMAALGREGEAPPVATGDGADVAAGLDIERARLDAEMAGLEAGGRAPEVDRAEDAVATIDAPALDASAPPPELRFEVMRAAGIAETFQGRTLPVRNRPSDVVEFLADRGGVRDEASRVSGKLRSHDLRKRWGDVKPFRTGRLVRNKGMSLDDAGGLLHEAGYFLKRPTVADVLELIDGQVTGGKKVYALHEAGEAAAIAQQRYQAKWGDEEFEHRRWELRDELIDYADFLDDDLVDDIIMARYEGGGDREPFEIMQDLMTERYQNLRARVNEEAGDASYEWRDEIDHAPIDGEPAGDARFGETDDDGRTAVGASARGGDSAGGVVEDYAGEGSELSAKAFDDPDTAAAIAQADSIEHGLRMAGETFDDLDAEAKSIEAVRGCLKPGGEAE